MVLRLGCVSYHNFLSGESGEFLYQINKGGTNDE